MNSNENTTTSPQAAISYPRSRLADAMVTALTHHSPLTRGRAEDRMRRWQQAILGMTDGTVRPGSRTPVDRFPAWVTLDVLTGGFATGGAAAGGELLPHELQLAERTGLPARRDALFSYYLTETGLHELHTMLDTGAYAVDVPEEAVLLTIAWLLRAGDYPGAVTVLDAVEPFAGELRFGPRPAPASTVTEPHLVWRHTAGQVSNALAAKRPNRRIDTMREALTVWAPFGDRLLDHWLATVHDGHVGARKPDGWMLASTDLLIAYTELAVAHRLCSKHRKPKSNLGIMRAALEDVVTGLGLTPRRLGLLQTAVEAQVRRRGLPGSPELVERRARDRAECATPTHHTVAQALIGRLAGLPQDEGITGISGITADVETRLAIHHVDANDIAYRVVTAPVPATLRTVVERGMAAPVETLIERGVVPSAEVLAQLVPQISAATFAVAYDDPALRTLTSATYRAFRRRRSVLLFNLERQVQLHELPWVTATRRHATTNAGAEARTHAYATLNRVAALAIGRFPGTILPNPIVRELSELARRARVELPLVEELAADIFMGAFSPKFSAAGRIAARLLHGTLYERYYGIDYGHLEEALDVEPAHRRGRHDVDAFTNLCLRRAHVGDSGGRYRPPAVNGTIIEQSQILTTHNLAVLVNGAGVQPAAGWPALAGDAFTTMLDLIERLHHNPRPLTIVKDAAYAWRQTLFFLSLSDTAEHEGFVSWASERVAGRPRHTIARVVPILNGLQHVINGGGFDPGVVDPYGVDPAARAFLGWATRQHWILRAAVPGGD